MKKTIFKHRFFFYGVFLASLANYILTLMGIESIWMRLLSFIVLIPLAYAIDNNLFPKEEGE